MNVTEERGFAWLVSEGYAPEAITFRRRQSPDFVTDDGKGWEIKLAREKTITFSPGQMAQLRDHPSCVVLIFDEAPAPTVVPVSRLKVPGYNGRFHAHLVDTSHLKQMRVETDAYLEAKRIAAENGLTLEAWASNALRFVARRQAAKAARR